MRKQVIILFILILFIFINGASTQQIKVHNQIENYQEGYVPGELLVKYKENVIGANGNEIMTKDEILVYEYVEKPEQVEKIALNKELYNLKFDNVNVYDVAGKYSSLPEVEYAEPNYIMKTFDNLLINNLQNKREGREVKPGESNSLKVDTVNNKNNLFYPFSAPNDASYSQQWGLKNINAEEAWNLTTGNSTVIITIIDTGVDWNHPDLALNIWNNTDEDCSDGIDSDNNGYVDDCRGYDFVNVSSGCSASDDCDTEDNNPIDYNGHGTHCAGIAGAVSNNNLGVTGVCWNCSIMAVRAGYEDESGGGTLATADVIQAIDYATNNNATIISMSFGGSHSVSIQRAINDSYANNVILVASAGNDGANSELYPCAYDNVICVAATNSTNGSWSSSNYGTWINLSVPGVSILNTYFDDTYTSLSGTSMATPMAAGAIGLIKSLFWNQNQNQIENALKTSGDAVDFSGVNIPRIDVYSAILFLDDKNPNVSLISPADNQISLTRDQNFSCNMTDWQLTNATFYLWNSTDVYYNESKNVSGIFNETVFNVTNLNYDSYKWNCLVFDNQSNSAYASSNFSLTIGNITVSLTSPSNGTQTAVSDANFSCLARVETGKKVDNITFYLWNSTDLIYNVSNNSLDNTNSSIFNYRFTIENEYYWNCESYNNISEGVFALSNFTISYDISNPNISLINPDDSASYTSNLQNVNFSYNISDNFEIDNCSLIINQVVNLTNSSVSEGVQNFTQSFFPGSYSWNVNCSDKAGNVGNSNLRSFTVSVPVTTASSGGGGGGSTIKPIGKTYVISNEQASGGYTKELNKNDKIKFTFFDERTEEHILTVNEIETDYIMIAIQSSPIYLILGIGQSAKLNLTSSDYYDLYVKLNSIEDKKADLTIQTIHEEIPKPSVTAEVVKEEVPEKDLMREINKLKIIVYGMGVLVLIAVFFIFMKYFEKKRTKRKGLEEHKKTFKEKVKPRKR